MKLNLTNNEVAFFCLIFDHDLPIIVSESFNSKINDSKIQEQFDSFYEKFISLNVIIKNESDTTISEDVQKLFVSIFSANVVVSLLSPLKTQCSFYYSDIGISLITNLENSFELQDIGSIDSSLEIIASRLKIKESGCDETVEIIENAQTIENIITNKKSDISEDIKCRVKSMSKILNIKDGEIILTERIGENGTIMTKLIENDGVIYQSLIYSDKGDIIVLGKNSLSNSLETILNFRGK